LSKFVRLTRRAKHRHNAIIETSLVDPRGTHPPRVFSSRSRSDGGGALRPRTRQTWSADRRAAGRAIAGRARANVPARGAGPVLALLSGANLVVSYFAKRGFANIERIIKR
jgi:hypothetical protein